MVSNEPDPNAVTSSLHLQPDDVNLTRTLGHDRTTVTDSASPRSLPNYSIGNELGRGGMGVVYLARQIQLNREVALKMVLSGSHASATERVRFLGEAEAIAAVQHSGIIQIYDFGTHDDLPFFAMEFCPGGSLATKLNGTPIPAKDAAMVTIKIAKAMQAAHEKGIIHRDLKPSNILFSADGEPKVTDFGLARIRDSGSGLTQTGAVLGSPSYMSPEQAEGKHDVVGPRSDVYSIGAILYECLTGRPPFRAATPLDTVMQVIKSDPVPPSKLAAKIPNDLETICLKSLNKDPNKRYTTAAEFADDLMRFVNGESILARPPTIVEKYVKSFNRRPLVHSLVMITALSIGIAVGVLTGTNKNLRKKQSLLEQETAIARAAEADADKQKVRATRRLSHAVDAVEKVMLRVAGEKWATRPELQVERRELIEEAISFFQTLGEEDSQDPLVKFQAGRANFYAAVSYLTIGETEKAKAFCEVAAASFQALHDADDSQSQYPRMLAETQAMIGNCHAIESHFTQAIDFYQTALKSAEKAKLIDPKNDDNLAAISDMNSSIALFYSFQRPDLAKEYHTKALAIGEELLTRPSPSYKARLIVLMSLANLSIAELQTNPVEGMRKMANAFEQIKILEQMKPPTARSAEMFVIAHAGLLTHAGYFKVMQKKYDVGLADMKKGIGMLETQSKISSSSFPIRVQLIQYHTMFVDALIRNNQYQEADALLKLVDAEKESMAKTYPNATWIAQIGFLQRSLILINQMRDKYDVLLIDAAHKITDAAPAALAALAKYNLACVYAVGSLKAPDGDRERLKKTAVDLLNELLTKTTYFQNPLNVKHLADDEDLHALRDRDDFKTFLNAAVKVAPKPQLPNPSKK